MSISNDIRNLLDIQDANIIFEENCVKEGMLNGRACKYITGKLTLDPRHYKHCGIKNEDYTVIKNGTQMSRITLPITGVHPTYLCLKKQRLSCKACDSSFTAETPIVKKEPHGFSRGSCQSNILVECFGCLRASGSIYCMALLIAVGPSPNPVAINFTLPGYVLISPAA